MKKLKFNNFEKGFTIIEVVLVLAIAGLIFLMVFLALPTLQKSQRDTQRKSDLARVKSAYQTFISNNKGRGIIDNDWGAGMPTWNRFLNNYLRANGEEFKDPSGSDYRIEEGPHYTEGRSTQIGDGVISLNYLTICQPKDDLNVTPGQKMSDITIRIRLEMGGVYCLELMN